MTAHDWTNDREGFAQYCRDHPLDASLGRDYRAKDDKDGVEHTLHGYKVPSAQPRGQDPGMFPAV